MRRQERGITKHLNIVALGGFLAAGVLQKARKDQRKCPHREGVDIFFQRFQALSFPKGKNPKIDA